MKKNKIPSCQQSDEWTLTSELISDKQPNSKQYTAYQGTINPDKQPKIKQLLKEL